MDEPALLRALDQGKISGAGLDVFKDENPDLQDNPFLGRDNVVITPHGAFYSVESYQRMQDISVGNIIHYLKGEYQKVNRIVNGIQA